ncbi:MAG: CapA family protein [Actinomycetota bacterium]|nr:CapA family protein [Actinomycetota bacterium]
MKNKFIKKNNPNKILFSSKAWITLLAIMILFTFSCSQIGILNKGEISKTDESISGTQKTEETSLSNEENQYSEDSTAELQKEIIVLKISGSVPDFIAAILKHKARELFGEVVVREEEVLPVTDSEGGKDSIKEVEINIDISRNDENLNNFIIICAVNNFFSAKDNIEFKEIEDFFKSSYNTDKNDEESKEADSNQDIGKPTKSKLYISNNIGSIFKKFYGDIENENIAFEDYSDIRKEISLNSEAIALIPFDELQKDLKVLNINSESIFSKDFSYSDYPLAFSVIFNCENEDYASKLKEDFEKDFYSNMDQSKLASVNMTGVTALVRGVANRMDIKGILYPAEKIAEILKDADITHISNEISFKENCNAGQSGTVFCSKPEYIELLRFVGTDVVELTGNHLNDYGYEYLEKTISMYDEEGWKYFGGGMNLGLSKHPSLFDINGNKIAFLGFNQFGPSYDWATKTQAGSAPPDNPFYISEIKRLKDEGYNVIFTFQYEEAYQYSPLAYQIDDFRIMRDAGADIVSGSQAHHPMGLELSREGLICYGLGNLFFDQMQSLGTRQGFIAKHIFYDNKHISTQIIPTLIEDYCQPRLMEDDEREDFLNIIYNKSIMQES